MIRGAIHRPLSGAALALAIAACAPVPAPAPEQPIGAADYEAAIARLDNEAPQSPEALNARLEYADFLFSQTASGDCLQRLTTAAAALGAVARQPAMPILLPLGPARIADGEYKLHRARAACGDPSARAGELAEALAAAQRAVGLYRDALDYQSAVVMQFNVAVTEHGLGNSEDATSALQAAIAMDRDYGFAKDAQDNDRLLLNWQGQPSADSDVAALMKDFPARTLAFKFDWSARDADVAVSAEDTSLIEGKTIRSRGTVALTRHIHATASGWTVSSDPGHVSYDAGDWPADARDAQWSMMGYLAGALLGAPAIEIGRDGDFQAVSDPQAFGANLAAGISAAADQFASAGTPGQVHGLTRDLSPAFAPDFIQSIATQDYGIQTATWIGAKLEQGTWYQMTTPLFLPALGMGHYLADYDLSFAFTRMVPCSADAPDPLCAEIVIHAIPNEQALQAPRDDMAALMKLPDKKMLHYWAMTDIRLVIDPATLLPYARDTRQSWYIGLDGVAQSQPIIESLRTVSTTAYH